MKNAEIDWNKAPEWAGAVIQGDGRGTLYWVERFGGISQRQRLTDSSPDTERPANMIEPHNWVLVGTRPTPRWNGEGLPPVGTVCEGQNSVMVWLKGTIVHIGVDQGDVLAIMQCEHEILYGEACDFRPIRTPEQIAADEREKAIQQMMNDARPMNRREVCADLYDAGYRKQDTAE